MLLRDERQKRDDTCALHGGRQTALMLGAISGYTARQNLAAFRDVFTQTRRVFVIDPVGFLCAKITDLALRPAFFLCGRALFRSCQLRVLP